MSYKYRLTLTIINIQTIELILLMFNNFYLILQSTKMDSNPQEYRCHYMSRQQSQHFYLTNQQQQTNYQSFRRRNLLFNFDVISKTLLLLVLLASLIQLSVASIPCSNYEYWDSKRDMCLQCTKCDVQMIVVSPCQAHKDTNCGPMSKLEIDWSQFRATEVNRKVILL